MIAAIHGTIVAKTADRVILATGGGVSYELAVPIGVLERLPADGGPVTLQTVLVVREDGWALYGFDETFERVLFQRLLAATGVGPKLALALVSTLGGGRLVRALKEGDLAVLCTVPGIGKKTAERLVVELRDRLRDLETPGGAGAPTPAEQAVQALVNLGYAQGDADRAVRQVVSLQGPGEPVDLIKQALQHLTQRP